MYIVCVCVCVGVGGGVVEVMAKKMFQGLNFGTVEPTGSFLHKAINYQCAARVGLLCCGYCGKASCARDVNKFDDRFLAVVNHRWIRRFLFQCFIRGT